MVANKVVLLTAAATLVESALGFNAHRHGNQHLDKRAMETEWVTEWVTVCVTAGQEEAAAAATSTTTKAAVTSKKNKAVGGGSDVVSTTTSTTVVVVPTSTSAAYVAPVSTSVAYVAPVAQTTLTTAIAAESTVEEAAVYTTSSAEEAVADVPETTEAVVEEVATTTKAAAVTTTQKKAAATSTTSSSSSSAGLSHKRGVAYNDAALANTFGDSCTNCGWAYGWSAWEQSSGSATLDSLTFIPLLHDDDVKYTVDWDTAAAAAIKAGSPALFSFNEPDIATQADLSVADAASGHVKWMNPFAGQALIGAPSVSNSGETDQGLDYLEKWIDACSALDEPCHYDFCNVHWYNTFEAKEDLFNHLESAYKLCGKPIWLTEFSLSLDGTATDAQKVSFLEYAIPKLEALEYLEGYAYFMVATDYLMSSSSSLSTTGQTYASASV